MARKKKGALHNPNFLNHYFYHTRMGLYTLVLIAVIAGVAAINMSDNASTTAVLGEKGKSENSGKGKSEEDRQKEREEKEERREEHKKELEQKFEVEAEGLKVQYKPFGDRVFRTVESSQKELELEDEVENELEDEVENEFEFEEELEIATSGGDVIVKKNKVKARSGHPLSIDVSTGQLIVTRPDGTQKAVTVLPDQAVENFLRHEKVELIGVEPPEDPGDDDGTGTESAGTEFAGTQSIDDEITETEEETETEIEIVERNDLLVYEIKGKKRVKLFGFIPVSTNTTGYVSTETGEVVDEEQSPIAILINLLSF